MAAAPQLMKLQRDPALDPQPGDVARAKGQPQRRVLEVRNGKLLIQTPMTRFLLNIPAWRSWCERTGAEFAKRIDNS